MLAAVAGYGPLQAYLDDPTVEELWIHAPDRMNRTDLVFISHPKSTG